MVSKRGRDQEVGGGAGGGDVSEAGGRRAGSKARVDIAAINGQRRVVNPGEEGATSDDRGVGREGSVTKKLNEARLHSEMMAEAAQNCREIGR